MLVGQAPASPLRSKDKPFSGQAGRVLFGWLARAGFTEEVFRARCYFTAITKCYPGPARSMSFDIHPGQIGAVSGKPVAAGPRGPFDGLGKPPPLDAPSTGCFGGASGVFRGVQGKGDRVPSAQERALCQPFLLRELALIQPTLLLTVGRISAAYFLGNGIDFTQSIGKTFEYEGRTILPLPHPSGVSRWTNLPANQTRLEQALALLKHMTHTS